MKASKIIYVKGLAGLGNRLFTINAAVDLAQRTGHSLHIDWTDGQFLEPGEDAFEHVIELKLDGINLTSGNSHGMEDDFPFLKQGSVYDIASPLQPADRVHLGRWAAKLPKHWSRWHACWKLNKSSTPDIFAPWSSGHLEYGNQVDPQRFDRIIPFLDYFPPSDRMHVKDRFRLKPWMEKEVTSFVREHKLGHHGVGLHIRATDKQPSASLDRIKEHLRTRFRDQPLFLATDNLEIANWVMSWHAQVVRFESESCSQPARTGQGLHQVHIQSGDYSGVESMYRASVADMWILSRCETLLYQGNSSFSLFSKYLHHDQHACIDWQTLATP